MEISFLPALLMSISFVVILGMGALLIISIRRYRKTRTHSSLPSLEKTDSFLTYEQLFRKGKITKEELDKIKSVILKRQGIDLPNQEKETEE